MKKSLFYIFLGLNFVLAATCRAENGVWNDTKDVADDTWQGTKEVTSDVWDGTKKVTNDVWDGTKKVAKDIKDGISTSDTPASGKQTQTNN